MTYQNFCLLGTHAYFGDNVQFAILMDEKPWRVMCNDEHWMVWWERDLVEDGFEPNEHWRPLSVDGEKLEKLFREADPWHWRTTKRKGPLSRLHISLFHRMY
jgi:hypothetical protein